MRDTHLRGVDLNLLVVLQAVLAERHITHAAKRLNMSQPAVSRALDRLRALFDDPLIVKCGRRMELTARASEVSKHIDSIIAEISQVLRKAEFDPGSAVAHVTICVSEGAIGIFRKSLLKIQEDAPNVKLELITASENVEAGMRSGDLDFYIDSHRPAALNEFASAALFRNGLKCVARLGTFSGRNALTRVAFESRRHVVIAGGTERLLGAALKEQQIERKIAIIAPGYFSAAYIVSESDLIMILPEMLASQACRLFPLEVVDLPFSFPDVSLYLSWHARKENDPLHRWLRELFLEDGSHAEARVASIKAV